MRRRARVVVVGVILAALGGAALIAYSLVEETYQFRSEAAEVLARLSSGAEGEAAEKAAIEVYEAASPLFRDRLLRDKFVDTADQLGKTLGRFVRIIDVTRVDRTAGIAGRTARIELSLEYEAGRTTGEMSFHQVEGDSWRLLGLSVRIPEPLIDKARALESQYERIKAPEEVIDLVSRILERVRGGDIAAVYAATSPRFRESVSEERFNDLIVSQRDALGRFVRVLAVISSGQNRDKSRARVYALLEFERVKTTGTFEFIKARGGDNGPGAGQAPGEGGEEARWLLVHFKIEVPQPLLPTR